MGFSGVMGWFCVAMITGILIWAIGDCEGKSGAGKCIVSFSLPSGFVYEPLSPLSDEQSK